MKHHIIIFLAFVEILSVMIPTSAYGLWVPETPERLLEQSETVFVGTITSVNVLEFERSNTYNVEENGVSRIIIENYTQTLDEYTVNIEEFLKNPQESHTITMLEATVGGVPGLSVSIGGFELSDRVLFYVPHIDGTNQYSPESFKIPKQCDAKTVLEKPRIAMGNSFSMIQEGVKKENNFTANKSLEFVYQRDMRTLDEKSLDFQITIRKETDPNKFDELVLSEKIHANSNPCEWIATAKAEFAPQAGNYTMWINITGDNGADTFSGSFSVKTNTSNEINLAKAMDNLQESFDENVSFGPFNMKDVVVGYGIGNGSIIVDVKTKYYESEYLEIIKENIQEIAGDVHVKYGATDGFTYEQICGPENKLVNGICINSKQANFDTELNQILLFISIGVILSVVSFIIWRKRK